MAIFSDTERGMALITTLLVTAVLVMVTVNFIFSVFIQTSRVDNLKNSARASVLAADGVTVGRAALQELLRVRPFLTLDEQGLSFSQEAGEGLVLNISAFDELARVSTRVVYTNTGAANEKIDSMYGRLLEVLKLDGRLKETLSDWIDADDEPRHYGGEKVDYYGRLPRPYAPANRYLRSVDELVMIKGYSPEVFAALAPHVTVYSPDGLVNINTASMEVLMALSDEVTEEMAKKIIERRRASPFKDRSELMKVAGFETAGFALQDKVAVQSRTFRIFSRGESNGAVRVVEAVVRIGEGVLFWRES